MLRHWKITACTALVLAVCFGASRGNVASALPREAFIKVTHEAHAVAAWGVDICNSLTPRAPAGGERSRRYSGSDVRSGQREPVGYQMPNSTCREFPVVKRR